MAAYKDLVGQKITKVTSNPPEPKTGQMWYNSTTGFLKGLGLVEAWAAGNSILTGRYNLAGSGTQTAGLIAGGTTPGIVTNTEHFDGIGWRNGGALNTGRDSAPMFGLSTAATFVGGYAPSPNGFRALVEEYNGTAWSEETDMPAPRAQGASAGTQTDGIVFGGNQGPPGSPETTSTTTLEYNGSSWTTGGAMSVNDRYLMGCGGSQAQALRVGGESDTDATEEYNGSSWTTGGNLNTGRYQGAASGTNTAGLVFGGNPNRTNTEGYDGTSWSNKPALGTGVEDTSGSAQGTNAEAFQAGQSASPTSVVQNWNSSTNTVTAAAWASGGNMPQRTNLAAASGSQTANIVYGGDVGPSWSTVSNQSVLYDGTSWTAGTNIPGAESNMGGTGTQTAGIYFGGYPNVTTTVEWDGSSFSGGGAMGTGREKPGHNIGIQTAAVAFGGYIRGPDSKTDATEEYNGSSWTAGGALNTARYYATGAGIETAGLAMNGTIEPPQTNAVEEYNGSSWTSVNSSPYSAGGGSSSGTQTAALLYGGNPSSPVTTTAGYDGTNWSTRPSMANAASGATGGHAATSELAIRSGGYNNTSGQTEEFTGETETANIADFATS